MANERIPPKPGIHIERMPQLAEAINREDDWTGTTDAAARRRAQTRLNTRAYRKRKALANKMEESSEPETRVEYWNSQGQWIASVSKSHAKELYNRRNPLIPWQTDKSKRDNLNIIFPLSSDHLITLLQFNVLRALLVNRSLLLGYPATPLDCADDVVDILPYPKNPEQLPSSLLPTALQQLVPHCNWIDIFPCPDTRDRLIVAAGSFDDDDLWLDVLGGLFEGFPDEEVERRGMVAWSPPWDISGWEMSENFVKKWGWLFNGPASMKATNRWRSQRGEERLNDLAGTC
ncbi:uncharacterized protein PgNI_02648 [Pyricularia grisea]|uniref:BZIP domain-containing protein n=1 Tax=Pyricularia grisea TaxID=148305 RepID=A0A6P8BAV7_PYRGI|nr:uncharacterized protein PgNI_02648 [Pyricularia grisea]TLD12965.1 hypothetical protein PgNI_02648 [Pyricularia grisea]